MYFACKMKITTLLEGNHCFHSLNSRIWYPNVRYRPGATKFRLYGYLNVDLLTFVYIINNAAQKPMSIYTPSNDCTLNLDTKYVNLSFENSDSPQTRSLSSFWKQNT